MWKFKFIASLLLIPMLAWGSGVSTPSNYNSASVSISGGTVSGVAITGSSIPLSNVTGAGTIATQSASSVAITGGTVAGVAITGSSLSGTTGDAANALAGGLYSATSHNMVGSRACGTIYTNTSGHVLVAMITLTNGSNPVFAVNGIGSCQATSATSNCTLVVPAGGTYGTGTGGGSITQWNELY